MKIGIFGNYGATNVGDEAILSALIRAFDGHKITVFSASPGRTSLQHSVHSAPLFPLGFRSFFRHGFASSRQALGFLDVALLGGGGLFQDDRLYACFLWAWQCFWILRLKKPLFICATGVGPLNTWLGRSLTCWVYRRAKIIVVRDADSRDLLLTLGLSSKKIHVGADPAFLFRPPVKTLPSPSPKNIILVSLRPWRGRNAQNLSAFRLFLEKLRREQEAELVFVSMQQIQEGDGALLDPLLKELGGSLYVPSDFPQLLQKMSQAQFAIGMRYHFLVAALLTGTPTLAISYSPKTDSLFRGTSLWSFVLSVKEVSFESLKKHFEILNKGADEWRLAATSRSGVLAHEARRGLARIETTLKIFDRS